MVSELIKYMLYKYQFYCLYLTSAILMDFHAPVKIISLWSVLMYQYRYLYLLVRLIGALVLESITKITSQLLCIL